MTDWEFEARPHRTARFATIIAAVIIVVMVVAGVLLRHNATGVYFRTADQVAMVLLGLLLGGAVLLLTRPRLRANARGVSVRNVISEKFFEWNVVRGLSFPDGASWARIELPDDEYVAVMAIQANDKERAVEAVQRFRALGRKYAGSSQGLPPA
ncbi:PH domain-containing protein [Skermania sp. ID1734]|uniref:PH domain-containing protein n=1 Tax=Skermania sp. ID1734 TaxID=2597516 RepID=UPI00117F377A|nr:PH domain-containing protein [Skermania sp. ID1734]TSD95400.1 PH domain-containing protein [Skermania sp. ID1734]